MFFLWCCGPRQRDDDDAERRAAQDVPPAETDWLLGGDPPTTYLDGSDAESSEEEEFIHDVLREAEGKMVNVTHDDPLQIHANLGIQYYLHDDGDTPSHDSYDYEPQSDAHRGRRSDRRKRRANKTNGAATANNNTTTSSRRARAHMTNGDDHDPSRSSSRSRSGTDSRSRSSDYAYGYDENGFGGYYNVNDYEYSNGYDAPSGSRDVGPEDDSYSPDSGPDPEEEARLRRLRGPKLSARILPLPRRQLELDEEEERIRREEETFGGGGVEERTPVQERKGMDLGTGAGPRMNGNGNGTAVVPKGSLTVEPLNEEDERTITALGDALWKALEDDLKIAEAPKIMHGWDD